VSGNAQKKDAEESFRNNSCNLQGVTVLPFAPRQSSLDCPAKSCWPIAANELCVNGPSQKEKNPIRFLDFSGEAMAIKILDDVPAGQERALLDEHGSRSVVG